MKHMKKIAGIMLALMFLLSMATTAFAAQTGSLTINGTVADKQYDLYRVFDLTQNGDNYSYSVNASFAGYFTAAGITDPVTHIGGMANNSDDLSNLAKNLLIYAIENEIPAIQRVTATDTSTTINGLDYGYYLLNPLGGSDAQGDFATMFALNTLSGNDTTISVKAVYPTITKTVDNAAVNEASIGDTVSFTLTSKVPDMTGYNRYYFIIQDKLSAGLTYDAITSVKVGDTTLTDADYTVTPMPNVDGTTSLEIVFKDFLGYAAQQGAAVTVIYDAVLNANAVVGTVNKNEAVLQYSNDPTYTYDGDKPTPGTTPPIGETVKSETETYTTSLTINKKDGDGNTLTGAAFKVTGDGVNVVVTTGDIFVEDTAGTYWLLKDGTYTTTDPSTDGIDQTAYADTTTKYAKQTQAVLATTGENAVDAEGFVNEKGQLTFAGLGAGTYTITETVTPKGYNPIAPITVTITFDAGTKTFSGDGDVAEIEGNVLSLDIVNQSGTVLPETGGIGTTIFYVLGGVLVAAAVILLITKKRMSYEK